MDGQERRACYSPALLAAQQKLEGLRQQYRAEKAVQETGSNHSCRPAGSSQTTNIPAAELSAQPRGAQQNSQPASASSPAKNSSVIKLYPDIALGMLKANQVAPGRLWLLLQHLDTAGCGWISLEVVRSQLAAPGAGLQLCGWRQLRNLLHQGEGIFWQRGNGRLWLRSVARVAAALNIQRLTGHPVALPIAALLQGIGQVRAHFYATFHSGRGDQGSGTTVKPIARSTLQKLSHASRRAQRRYEKRAGVRRRPNIAIHQAAGDESDDQSQAWRHGRAFFRFTDHRGLLGPAGVTYNAWQLPNHYVGPHQQLAKGRQKRINRELADLFMKGMTGNGEERVNDRDFGGKRFYASGDLAAKGYGRNPDQDVYWPDDQVKSGRCRLWQLLSGQEKE
ncbi:MAG: hypothetical protein L0332_15825 [Chloroflexi bacterium]|nr:hypothetical protein [Chloroflexota bacterium]MCI0578677.1 hypothetical protein [Chloroflexota bacterium]MCI0643277.1 hypothetical protein [Chloroflexota bacterium]MCI0728170.1 hypothetical protein [Chloroflexota bacterium]